MSCEFVLACVVCFGAADGPMLDAARLGVLVMAGVTCVMLGAFGLFFARVARRTSVVPTEAETNE
jgi:hypothetical protein